MRTFLIFLAILITTNGLAQKVSESFNPIVKGIPRALEIRQHSDGNYLIFGDFAYYEATASGSLIKADSKGKRVPGFENVFTDQPIENLFVLPSGKILIQGPFNYTNGVRTGNMAMLNSDGSIDGAFSVNKNWKITSFAVQSNGQVVVMNGSTLSRLNTDGSMDATFSTTETVNYARIAIAQDDRIYLQSGTTFTRFEKDGTVDNTFSFSVPPFTGVGTFALQSDGKILVEVIKTMSEPPFTQTTELERFNSNGDIDNSFTPAVCDEHITSILIRSNGKIAFTGLMTSFNSVDGNVFELNADGTFSRSLITTDFNGMNSLFEDSHENIFVTGGFKKVNNTAMVKSIAKLNADYSLDQSFKLPVFPTALDFYVPIAVQSDGKVLFGGGFGFGGVGGDSLRVARVLADGSLDQTFKPEIKTDLSNMVNPTANAIAVQPDGKIVIGGSNLFMGPSPAFNRMLPDGKIDNSFQVGTGPSQSNGWAPTVALVQIKDSKIYVFGGFDRYNNQTCQSFVILDMQGNKIGPNVNSLPSTSYFQDVEIQPDGKIVLMGTFPLSGTDTRKFVRLNQDGTLDDTFLLKTVDGNVNDFEIDDDGNILITGNTLELSPDEILLRYKSTGERDNTLAQGTGFTNSSSSNFFTGYFVETLKPNLIAVGGAFAGYNGTSSPGLVIMDYQGSIVAFENEYDSTSMPIGALVYNNILYISGHLSQHNSQVISGAAKVLFPLTGVVSNQNAEAQSESSINVTWTGAYEGAEKITVEQSSPDADHYELVASIGPHEQSYVANELSEVTPYHFRLQASNEYYTAASFEVKDTTLIAPQVALPPTDISSESFVANWEYLPGTDSCMLQVSSDGFSTFVNGYENLIVKTGSKLIENLEVGKLYAYRVKRFRSRKASAFSDAVVVNIVSVVENKEAGVHLYPNPMKDYLTVELPGPVTSASVTIRSLRGELLGSYICNQPDGLQVDTTHLPPGIFIVTVSEGEKRHRFKIVK